MNLYDHVNLADEHGLIPGGHAGEFEAAILLYYRDYRPAASSAQSGVIRPRPPAVYGLPIGPRSTNGVIASEVPDMERALTAAPALDADVDCALHKSVLTNLDLYFNHWHLQHRGDRNP